METETPTSEAETEHISNGDNNPSQSSEDRDALDREILEDKKSGLSTRQLASKYSKSKGWIERSLNRSLKRYAQSVGMVSPRITREEIVQKIFNKAPKALEKVEALMESADKQEVQAKCAFDILDRAGFAPVQKSITLSLVEEMSREELLKHLDSLLSEAGSQVIVEGTSEVSLEPASKAGAESTEPPATALPVATHESHPLHSPGVVALTPTNTNE